MLTFNTVPNTNIVEFIVEGQVTPEQFQDVVPKFVAAAEEHDTLRILKVVRDFDKLDPAVFGKQIGEVFAHLGEITHAALVADKQWEAAVNTMGNVYPFGVKFFELSQLEEARQLLRTAE